MVGLALFWSGEVTVMKETVQFRKKAKDEGGSSIILQRITPKFEQCLEQ